MVEVVMSPLQMERLLFTKVHVEVNKNSDQATLAPEFDFDDVPVITEIAAAVKSGQEENPADFMVKVRIAILNTEENAKPAPYHIDVEAQAVFHLNPVIPVEKRDELVRINGSSMIIGAIRETITQITSRSAFGPLILPSLRVQSVSENSNEASKG